MLLRFGFLYSCFMIVAGSSLLAELPADSVPTLIRPPAPSPLAAPAPAEPMELKQSPAYSKTDEVQPTPIQPASLEILQQKLDQLQKEVSRLRRDRGVASQYQMEFLLAEISLKKLRELDPEIQGEGKPLSVVELLNNHLKPHILPTPQFRALELCLKSTEIMKTLAKPSLSLREHEPAAYLSGQEIPVPAVNGRVQPVSYRTLGTSAVISVNRGESGMLNVEFRVEQSVPDEHSGARLNGLKIPVVTADNFNSTVQIRPGQTILMGGETRNEQDNPICLLAAFTIMPIESPELIATPPTLQPIPETGPLLIK